MRSKSTVAVHAFLVKDDKLLLMQRANSGYFDGWWSVPAGHVEAGETYWEALQRELYEETLVKPGADIQPKHIMQRIRPNDDRIDYFYLLDSWVGNPEIGEPDKCGQLQWTKIGLWPTETIPYIKFAWEKISQNLPFSYFYEQ